MFLRTLRCLLAVIVGIGLISTIHAQAKIGKKYLVHKESGLFEYDDIGSAVSSIGSNGGKIMIPSGVTTITSTISLPAKTTLQGQGPKVSVIRILSPTATAVQLNGNDIQILGLSIARGLADNTYTVSQITGNGIDINGKDGAQITNCEIQSHYNCIYAGDATYDVFDLRISRCTIHRARNTFISLYNAGEIYLDNTLFVNSLNIGIYMSKVAGIYFSQCDLFGAKSSGVYIGDTECNNLLFDHFVIDTTRGAGLTLNYCTNVTYTSGWVASAGVSLPSDPVTFLDNFNWDYNNRVNGYTPGIDIQSNVGAVNISDNLILFNAGDGIFMSSPRDIVISNNLIHTNSRYSSTNNAAAIRLYSVSGNFSHINITGNRCYNDPRFAGGPTNWQKYGFNGQGNGDYLMITDNDFKDAAHTASVNDTTVATNKIINSNF